MLLRPLWTLLPIALTAACTRGGSSADVRAAELPRLPLDSEALELDPLLRERLAQALADCDRAAPGALLELARTYDANGLDELAARTYRLCLANGSSASDASAAPARVRYHLACSLEQCSRSDEALLVFEEVRRLAPEYAPAQWRAGNLLVEQGRAEEARAAFERALALEPAGVPARLGLARVELFEGRPAAALEVLAPLNRPGSRERFVHGLLARARRALGDEAGASAELRAEERALETSWVDPWTAEVQKRATGAAAAMKKANDFLLAGDASRAMETLEPVYRRCPENLALVQLFAKASIDAGALDRASEVVARAEKRFPDQYRLELYAGLIALGRKNFERAEQALESSLALNPSYGPTHAALGEVELHQGALEAAEASFARALEQGEESLRTRILYAQVELQLGKAERACTLLEDARSDFPASVAPPTHLAEAYARRGNFSEAHAALADAERIDASFPYLAKVRDLVAGLEAGAQR